MRHALLFACAALTLAAGCAAPPAGPSDLTSKEWVDRGVFGVKAGMNEADAKKALGEPETVLPMPNDDKALLYGNRGLIVAVDKKAAVTGYILILDPKKVAALFRDKDDSGESKKKDEAMAAAVEKAQAYKGTVLRCGAGDTVDQIRGKLTEQKIEFKMEKGDKDMSVVWVNTSQKDNSIVLAVKDGTLMMIGLGGIK